jgi:2-polyprenyl-6-methoxyphenol hydroxylase-like FAD-dependent oxidoreductase
MRVIIIDGGIGGLAAAIALRRANLEPIVVEQAAALREVGSGISLWPNALKALSQLGIADPIRRLALPERRAGCARGAANAYPNGTARSSSANSVISPLFASHRVAFRLARGVRTDAVALGLPPHRLFQNDERVHAHLADGSHLEAGLLIGANGLRSVIRNQLFGGPSQSTRITLPGEPSQPSIMVS